MLKHRIISGCLIGAAALFIANYLPPLGDWIIILIISSLAQLEFYSLLHKSGIPNFWIVGLICGGALISATFFAIGPEAGSLANAYRWENIVLLASIIAVFVRQFPQKYNPKPIETIACTLFGIWYVPFMMNFITRLAFTWNVVTSRVEVDQSGRLLMLYLIIVVKCTDIGAYTVGRLIGRHKLCPRISPGKTIEGFFGGILFALVASLLFCHFTDYRFGASISLKLSDALILGVLMAISGTVGDLFESLLKRAANTKDSSTLIPGMGGILDVMDSLLFGAPVLYAYMKIFLQ
jgi:phosphatidate cytidylyltransferase